MTPPDPSDEAAVAQYRAELRAVARAPRLAGFAFVMLGFFAVMGSNYAGSAGQVVLWIGYAALAIGWALMLAAIFLRTRYHRRRMAELD